MEPNEKFYLVQRACEGVIMAYTMIAESPEQAIELVKYDLAFIANHDGNDAEEKSVWENAYWAHELEFIHGATRVMSLDIREG